MLVSAVILGLASVSSWQLWNGFSRAEQQRQLGQQRAQWMELQLQRDRGLLQQQAQQLAPDCSGGLWRERALAALLLAWQQSEPLAAPAGVNPRSNLVRDGEHLVLEVASAGQQRRQLYSLEGLGLCSGGDDPA